MPISYAFVKQLHVAVVVLTIVLFVVRATWRLQSSERLQQRWVKIVPHLIDTVLLLSGAWLAWQLGATGVRGWLGAKLIALVFYIAFGVIALRTARTRGLQIAAMLGAILTFAYIVSVALTKSPPGLFAQ